MLFGEATVVGFSLMTLLFGSCLYLLMCVDPNSSGILGKLHRFIFNKIPLMLSNNRFFGSYFTRF